MAMGLLMASGCSKFLDQKPQDFASSTTFFTTPTQINEVMNGAYSGLQTLYSGGGDFWGMSEMRSDNTTFEYNNEDRGSLQLEDMDYYLVTTDNNYVETIWSNLYGTISQCNGLLDNIDHVTFTDDTLKSRYIGQAEFLRAFYYFNLVRLWGNVPLVLHQVSDPNKAYVAKASVDSIYLQIISDATDAASRLPVAGDWSSADVGRATQGAANTLLGEVYMTRKNFPSALKAFEKVTGYSLLTHYADLYNPANKNNAESVFEVQYSNAIQGEYSDYLYSFAPLYSGFSTIGAFDPNSGSGRNIPTRDMLAAYEKGDARKNASVAWFVDPLNISKGYAEAQHDSVPYVKKYATKPIVSGQQDNDFYIYRYAQVLLWMSEAINEVDGPTAQAYSDINQIRHRAGLAGLTPGLSKANFRTAVYREQRVESAFEDHRWFQLLRTGQALEVMTQNGLAQKKYQTWLPAAAYQIQAYQLLFPIPLREVNLNDLPQNPGWH